MSVTVVIEVLLSERSLDDFHLQCQAYASQTRLRPGNLGIQVKQDQDNPALFVVIEEWRTRADYEGYTAWRQDRGDFDALSKMIERPLERRFLEHIPV